MKNNIDFTNANFGIEIEMTGITRSQAANAVARLIGGTVEHTGTYYDVYTVCAQDGRKWKFMSDGSLRCERKANGVTAAASSLYSVELVSPILNYRQDINTLQEIVREIRRQGAFVNSSCGIHIHLDGGEHTAKTITNFINIIASKNDLFYNALQIDPARAHFCKKIDKRLVDEINLKKPQTTAEVADIWYKDYDSFASRNQHYHQSRYHFLNLHSFFTGHHTVELRGFNSTLHAGVIRSYVALALALNNQALNQKRASAKKAQDENEKFAMRTYLKRLGMNGDEFKNCRKHLCSALSGNSAWRYAA